MVDKNGVEQDALRRAKRENGVQAAVWLALDKLEARRVESGRTIEALMEWRRMVEGR